MLSVVIFDSYGTLISTGNGSVKAVEKILAVNNRTDVSAVTFYSKWKKYHREHINALTSFENEETIFKKDLRKLYSEYGMQRDADIDVSIMLDSLLNRVAFPESKTVLERLSSKYRICVGSTSDTYPLITDVNKNNLSFHKIFTSEMLKCYKPQKVFYTKILDELNIKASQALFVGDSLIDDVYGPSTVGIRTCWINRKGQEIDNTIIPDYHISSLDDLFTII